MKIPEVLANMDKNREQSTHEEKVLNGLGWTFAERILAQGVSFAVSIILARLLLPDEFGIIAIVLVFINIANVFVTNGLGQALIHQEKIDENEYSTVFWMSFVFSVVLYFILFFSSPLIADFYNAPILSPVLRVLSLKVVLASLNTVQHAYVSKTMRFRSFFFATLIGTVVSAVVGVLMAYKGFGVWSLVAQYLTNSIFDTLFLQLTIKWKPRFVFKIEAAKSLLNYGWKLTASALVIAVYNELRSIIIGRVYSTEDLAYYNKGNHFPSVLINNLNSAIEKVFFPSMVLLNSNIEDLKKFTKKTLKMSSYIVFPALTWLFVAASPIVTFLLTDKWNQSVPFLQIMCIFWITQPLQTVNWQVLKAMGRSDLCFKLEIIKKIIGLVLVLSTMMISVKALAWSAVAFSFVSMFVNMIPLKKLINYPIAEQIFDTIPILICTLCAGVAAYFILLLKVSCPVQILLQFMIGFFVYILMSMLLCKESLNSCIALIMSYVNKVKK